MRPSRPSKPNSPTGPHSALTANVPEKQRFSLCATKLVMPTEITAQNGAVIKQQTKIGLTGCVKASHKVKLTRAQKLKKALKACRKKFKHNKAKRVSCGKARPQEVRSQEGQQARGQEARGQEEEVADAFEALQAG